MRKYKFDKKLQKPVLSGKDSRQTGNQLLVENAVCYFIKNHQMDAMTGGYNIISGQFVTGKQRFDVETEDVCIEIKTFILPSDKGYGYIQERFRQSIKHIIGYGNSLLRDKRKILLVVGQEGICKEIRGMTNREAIMSLIRSANMGLELWIAEIKFEPTDGITLLSFRNIDNILLNGQYLQKGGEKANG